MHRTDPEQHNFWGSLSKRGHGVMHVLYRSLLDLVSDSERSKTGHPFCGKMTDEACPLVSAHSHLGTQLLDATTGHVMSDVPSFSLTLSNRLSGTGQARGLDTYRLSAVTEDGTTAAGVGFNFSLQVRWHFSCLHTLLGMRMNLNKARVLSVSTSKSSKRAAVIRSQAPTRGIFNLQPSSAARSHELQPC